MVCCALACSQPPGPAPTRPLCAAPWPICVRIRRCGRPRAWRGSAATCTPPPSGRASLRWGRGWGVRWGAGCVVCMCVRGWGGERGAPWMAEAGWG